MLSRLTLRQKLIIVLAIPMIVLAVLAASRIGGAINDKSVAASQQDEVDRTVALFQLANTVRAERDIVLLGGGTDTDLAVRRANVDNILSRLRVPEAGYSPEVQEGLAELAASLDAQRLAIGNSMDRIRLDTVASGESAQMFDELAASTLALVDFNEDLVVDPETSAQLSTLQLAVEFNESLSREAFIYFQTSTLSRPEQTSRVLRDAADRGQRSSQLEETLDQLATDEAAARFALLTSGDAYQQFIELRESMAEAAVRNRAIDPLDVEVLAAFGLRPELEAYQGELLSNVLADASDSQTSSQSALWRTIGFAALIGFAVAALMFALYRSIRRPLRRLTDSALHIAEEELPTVVSTMRASENVDESTFEVTPLRSDTDDEIGQLVESFNKLHVTAVGLAAEQAQSRRTASDMFANLGRRNQRLLTQVLDEMDDLERDEQNPRRLEKLFSIDQKITRMRRNAESLVVLAGQHTPRQWSEPSLVSNVIRAAMSEVENFDRIKVRQGDDLLIKGTVVADLTHLLAELLENALRFSPPSTPVEVGVYQSGDESIIAIIDRGVGLNQSQRQAFNELIAAAATSEETPSKRLGHYVVGRLASRHGIVVALREDPVTGGTVARVVLGPAIESEKPRAEVAPAEKPAAASQQNPPLTVVSSETPEATPAAATPAAAQPAAATPAAATPAAAQPAAAQPAAAQPAAATPAAAQPAAAQAPRPAPAAVAAAALVADDPIAPAVPAGRRVPGANFASDDRGGAQPTRTREQAQRLADHRKRDERPLPAAAASAPGAPSALPRRNVPQAGPVSSRHQAAGPISMAPAPSPRVPGQNLPASLVKPKASRPVAPDTSADEKYWEQFGSFQTSSKAHTEDNQ